MITKDTLPQLLDILGFEKKAGKRSRIRTREYKDTETKLSVDLAGERFLYPEGVQADRDTTKNFSDKENFVVFECVHTLFTQGYKPENIVLEPRTPGGREDGYYYGDILVRNNNGDPYLLIECKTAGEEFQSAWKKTQQDGGQLFRYFNSYRKAQFLCLYSSNILDGKVKRDYRLIRMIDNEERLREDAAILSFSKIASEKGSFEDYFNVWAGTYEKDYTTRGAFEETIPSFGIGSNKYTAKDDLQDVDNEEIKKKYNEFAVILRQHNVGSHENAFDKLVNLFLAKVVDETNNPEDLHFYWKGTSYDDDFSLQDRLQRLYRDGMKKFLGEDVTYIENSEIDKAFRWVKNDTDSTKRTIKDFFRQLKFFSENDFSFISVHNKRLFHQNAEILRKVVKMLQDIRLRTSEENQNQLLGDLFEGFLNKGVKQSEGQFFTPMPIVRFIVSSLPLEQIIKESPEVPLAIDYACGAGHFLTEYDFRIKEFVNRYHPEIPLKEYYSRTVGIEKEYRLSKVTKVSAFMYGHDETKVIYADALNNVDDVKDGTFSVLIANPPYAVSGFLETLPESIRTRYQLFNKDINIEKNNAIETFFMERSAQLMKAGGVAGIILPVSVLNKNGIYMHAREIILKNFEILSLTKFDKNTFGKTNTSTVTMFLRRKETNTPEYQHFYNRVESWFSAQHDADEVYEDTNLLDAYCSHMDYNIEDYRQFLNGEINETLKESEVIQGYSDSFFGSQRNAMSGVCEEAKKIRTRFKAKEKTVLFKRLPENEQASLRNDAFYSFVREIEKEKLYYFILAFNSTSSVALVNMPSGTTDGKQFLGYEWSDTKGNEGIKYLHVKKTKQNDDEDGNAEDDDTMQQIRGINGIVTPLFNPSNLYDELKINSVIRNNYFGLEPNIPEGLEEFISFANLVEMIDFKSTAFKKELRTNVSLKVEVTSRFPIVKLGKYCESINPSKEEIRTVPNGTVVSFVEMASLGFGRIDTKEDKTIAELSEGGYTYFKENDVLIAKISPSMENGKCAMATGLTNGLGLGSTEFHVIRGKNKAQAKFILEYLNREYIRKIAASNETGASGHRRVPEFFYTQMPIPEVPNDVLKKIEKECLSIDSKQVTIEMRKKTIEEEIETMVAEAQSSATTLLRLNNTKLFDISIGNRVLKEEITPGGKFEIFSANVFEPFGEMNTSVLNDFSKPSVIWGIDGDWMVNYMEENKLFSPTDHCGVIRVLDDSVVIPRYLVYPLLQEGILQQFSRVNRASTERIKALTIRVPSMAIQKKVASRLEVLTAELAKINKDLKSIPQIKQSILDKYIL